MVASVPLAAAPTQFVAIFSSRTVLASTYWLIGSAASASFGRASVPLFSSRSFVCGFSGRLATPFLPLSFLRSSRRFGATTMMMMMMTRPLLLLLVLEFLCELPLLVGRRRRWLLRSRRITPASNAASSRLAMFVVFLFLLRLVRQRRRSRNAAAP